MRRKSAFLAVALGFLLVPLAASSQPRMGANDWSNRRNQGLSPGQRSFFGGRLILGTPYNRGSGAMRGAPANRGAALRRTTAGGARRIGVLNRNNAALGRNAQSYEASRVATSASAVQLEAQQPVETSTEQGTAPGRFETLGRRVDQAGERLGAGARTVGRALGRAALAPVRAGARFAAGRIEGRAFRNADRADEIGRGAAELRAQGNELHASADQRAAEGSAAIGQGRAQVEAARAGTSRLQRLAGRVGLSRAGRIANAQIREGRAAQRAGRDAHREAAQLRREGDATLQVAARAQQRADRLEGRAYRQLDRAERLNAYGNAR